MNPAEALSRAAIGALRRGEVDRARYLLERAWTWDRKSGCVHEAVGLLALHQRLWRPAERSFRAAIDAGRFTARAYTGLGIALLEQGVEEAARISFGYALEVSAPDHCPWARRAQIELRRASKQAPGESPHEGVSFRLAG